MYIENCLSAASLTSTATAYTPGIGTIVGAASKTNANANTISDCIWTDNVGTNDVLGRVLSDDCNVTVSNTNVTELNKTTLDKLNNYASSHDNATKWVMLHLSGGSINNHSGTLIVTQRHFPRPVKGENAFKAWCINTDCTEYCDADTECKGNYTDLYAVWNVSSVVFDLYNNGTTLEEDYLFGAINYPENPTRESCIFKGWNNNITKWDTHFSSKTV